MATDAAVTPYMLGPDEGRAIWFLATRMTIKATHESTGGAFGLLEALAPPGFGPPLHVHHGEDEPMWVLEGRVTFTCGEHAFHAGPGSFVFLPRGVPHTFVVEGTTPARILTLLVPAGLEHYFEGLGVPATGAGLCPQPLDPAKLSDFQRQYRVEHLGPPPGR